MLYYLFVWAQVIFLRLVQTLELPGILVVGFSVLKESSIVLDVDVSASCVIKESSPSPNN